MKCPFCGKEFRGEDGLKGCAGCVLAGNCHMTKCPNCGYEIPEEPRIIKAFNAWRGIKNRTARKS